MGATKVVSIGKVLLDKESINAMNISLEKYIVNKVEFEYGDFIWEMLDLQTPEGGADFLFRIPYFFIEDSLLYNHLINKYSHPKIYNIILNQKPLTREDRMELILYDRELLKIVEAMFDSLKIGGV